jgi:hypothetical protein
METVSPYAFFALLEADFLDRLAVLGSGRAVGSLEGDGILLVDEISHGTFILNINVKQLYVFARAGAEVGRKGMGLI